MTFEDFRTWFTEFDSTLAGGPPSLPQWWELKARLDAVERTASSSGTELPSRPALPAPLPPAPQAAQADYDPAKDANDSYYAAIEAKRLRGDARADADIDDAPASEFSVYEEAVQLLRKPRRASRAAP